MKISYWKAAIAAAAMLVSAEAASAQKVLKLGTVGFKGMPMATRSTRLSFRL